MATNVPTHRKIHLDASRLRAVAIGLGIVFGLLAGANAAYADICVWTGRGSNNLWSNLDNWNTTTGSCPLGPIFTRLFNNTIVFSDGARQPTNVNDIVPSVDDIVIQGVGAGSQAWNISSTLPFPVVVRHTIHVSCRPDANGNGPSLLMLITSNFPSTLRHQQRDESSVPEPEFEISNLHSNGVISAPLRLGAIDINLETVHFIVDAPIEVSGPITSTEPFIGSPVLRVTSAKGPSSSATLTLLHDNTYVGQTLIEGAEVVAMANQSLGWNGPGSNTILNPLGTLRIAAGVSLSETVALLGGSIFGGTVGDPNTSATIAGDIVGNTGSLGTSGTFTVTGRILLNPGAELSQTGGTVILANASNTVPSWLVVTGTLRPGSTSALAGVSGIKLNVGGGLELADGISVGSTVTLGRGAITVPVAAATATITGPIVGDGGTLAPVGTLTISGRVLLNQTATATLTQNGGTVILANANNTITNLVVQRGTLRQGVAGVLAGVLALRLSSGSDLATLDLNGFDATVGVLEGGDGGQIQLGARTLTINAPITTMTYAGTIAGTGAVVKTGFGTVNFAGSRANTYTGPTIVQQGPLGLSKSILGSTILGPLTINGVNGGGIGADVASFTNQLAPTVAVTVTVPGRLNLEGSHSTIASLTGDGPVRLGLGSLTTGSGRSAVFAGTLTGTRAPAGLPPEAYFRLIKVGVSSFVLTGTSDLGDLAVIDEGFLQVDGRLNGGGVLLRNGTLSGIGRIASTSGVPSRLTMRGGNLRPGDSAPGILHGDDADFSGGLFFAQIAGAAVGTGYDQLDLTGNLTLSGSARLIVQRTFGAPQGSRFTVVNLAAGKTVTGMFQDLPEGATLTAQGQRFSITYHGGDGNDVVLTALDPPPAALTYYLSEGATGSFFDEDILIANPNATAAPVTVTFTKKTGEPVVVTRTIPAQSRLTLHADTIPGLESTVSSAQVRSEANLPLAVERSMFWDETYYAGHTASAASQPSPDWLFANGAQGAVETFVTVSNPNATAADVTFTFQIEHGKPVQQTYTVDAESRFSLDVPRLPDGPRGIAVHGTQPIVAERSIYASAPSVRAGDTDRIGGTSALGVPSAATQWFFADGATGSFFTTVVSLRNPQNTPAHVTLTYLLDIGDTVTVPKTIAANTMLTTNVADEADPRLHDAALSTVVNSDVPIVAERAMHWPVGTARPDGEGHTNVGTSDAGTKWALAEGRTGGPQNFHTYIVLGNPQKTAATVTITYLRETGAPIVQTVTVPATSRFNVDTANVDGLDGASFGALVEVTNAVPIVVERSMYWDANGVPFSGGTNVTGTRLP